MPIAAQHLKAARLHLQKSDPVMKRLVKQIGPCQLKTRRDRFRTLVDSIISQQISVAAARTILGRLTDAFQPEPLSASAIAEWTIDDLRSLGVSRQKAGYLLDLCQHVDDGRLDLPSLHRLANEEVIQTLTQVRGIGVWTAQMFLMFCLGRLDVLPHDDLGLRNAVTQAYSLEQTVSRPQLQELAAPWAPYQTVASWYLWRSLEGTSA